MTIFVKIVLILCIMAMSSIAVNCFEMNKNLKDIIDKVGLLCALLAFISLILFIFTLV